MKFSKHAKHLTYIDFDVTLATVNKFKIVYLGNMIGTNAMRHFQMNSYLWYSKFKKENVNNFMNRELGEEILEISFKYFLSFM